MECGLVVNIKLLEKIKMSCMYHLCDKCKRTFMDNYKLKECPICKSSDISNVFDEEDDRDNVVNVWEDD